MFMIETAYDIVSTIISNDSSQIICVLKASDERYEICCFRTSDYSNCFRYSMRGNYIKASEVIQNDLGTCFCCPYLKDGEFQIIVFNIQGQVIRQANVSEMLGLDANVRPSDNFPYPMMGAAFIKNGILFINVYHTKTQHQITFTYNYANKQMLS